MSPLPLRRSSCSCRRCSCIFYDATQVAQIMQKPMKHATGTFANASRETNAHASFSPPIFNFVRFSFLYYFFSLFPFSSFFFVVCTTNEKLRIQQMQTIIMAKGMELGNRRRRILTCLPRPLLWWAQKLIEKFLVTAWCKGNFNFHSKGLVSAI